MQVVNEKFRVNEVIFFGKGKYGGFPSLRLIEKVIFPRGISIKFPLSQF